MQASQNPWAPPAQTSNAPNPTGQVHNNNVDVSQAIQQALDRQAAKHSEEMSNLAKRFEAKLLGKGKGTSSKKKNPPSIQANQPSTSTSPKGKQSTVPKAPPVSTPRRIDRAASAPPQSVNVTPKNKSKGPLKSVRERIAESKGPSPKRHPQQMQTGDFPSEFTTTKESSVPKAPELRDLQEFYNRFSNDAQVQAAASSTQSPGIINSSEVQCFKNVQGGRMKLGKSIIHIPDNQVRYARGLLTRLGLRVWCPNLEEDATSLYNAACRIAAITTFQEMAVSHAYDYLNINPKMVTATDLLIQAYNHYVHFVVFKNYNKEKKESGKIEKDSLKRKHQKNRERLRDERVAFARANKLPTRYIEMLLPVGAHSDDEESEKGKFWKIKTLPYRSANVGKFMRRLDNRMMDAAIQEPNHKRRIRRLPKEPIISDFKIAPKGLALDFYDPDWFKNLSAAQQNTIPNRRKVALLPNANESLLPTGQTHPDEKLKDTTFNRIYLDIHSAAYAPPNGDEEEVSSGDEDDGKEEGEEGEGIDKTGESSDACDDEFFEEGDAGDLYDPPANFTDNEEVDDGDDDEEEDGDDDEDNDQEDSNGELIGAVHDDDYDEEMYGLDGEAQWS
ncbi:hypothetical protein PGTUg99_034577 [Puccinia graminis f. sp. tritici]|uniref:Uncharacterized protein n=1 Tax=Puccinia graminis f. sp. tritici TaxID=56615 RepID=A0A5B0RPN2_PUCGR|nr:hypothetical protein PGTUg99_034577 [Puccinia graminis f. sp. tritici]